MNNKDIYIEKSGSSMFQQQVGWEKVLGKSSSCLSWNICVCCEHCTLSADKDTAQMDEIKKTTHELFAFKMFCRFLSSWTQIHPFQVFTIIVEFLTDKNSKKAASVSLISFPFVKVKCDQGYSSLRKSRRLLATSVNVSGHVLVFTEDWLTLAQPATIRRPMKT